MNWGRDTQAYQNCMYTSNQMKSLVHQRIIDLFVFVFIQSLIINLFSVLCVLGMLNLMSIYLSFIHMECSHKVPP